MRTVRVRFFSAQAVFFDLDRKSVKFFWRRFARSEKLHWQDRYN